jgi:hypothetical protein
MRKARVKSLAFDYTSQKYFYTLFVLPGKIMVNGSPACNMFVFVLACERPQSVGFPPPL